MISTSQCNFAKAESPTSIGEFQSATAVTPMKEHQGEAWETPLHKASFQETPPHFSCVHPHRFRSVDMLPIFIYL